MSTQYKSMFLFGLFLLSILAFGLLACGPNGGCGDTVPMDSPQCQPKPTAINPLDAITACVGKDASFEACGAQIPPTVAP